MNHIIKLQKENKELRERIESMETAIREYRGYLMTAEKFLGVDSRGGRKDWVSTTDVSRFLADVIG